jgi:hypothetical protein
MRIHPFTIPVALVLVMLGSGGRALAQVDGRIDVTIPFRFRAVNTMLPPGDYVIEAADLEEPDLLWLHSREGNYGVYLLTENTEEQSPANETYLTFDRFTEFTFLTAIRVEGQAVGYQIEESRAQRHLKQAARAADRTRITGKHVLPGKTPGR